MLLEEYICDYITPPNALATVNIDSVIWLMCGISGLDNISKI